MIRQIINNHTIEVRDNSNALKYTEKGGGIAYLDNGIWKETTNSFASIIDSNYDFKNDEGDAKVYIGKELIGTIKYEKDGTTYLSSFIGIGYCSESGEDFEIFDAPDSTAPVLDGDRALFTALQYGYVEYEKIFGEFIQRIVIPDKNLLPTTTKEYICAVTEFNQPLLDILDDQRIIRKFIIKDNKNYLVEMVKISNIETSEIIINYSTKSGALTTDEVWTTGTYYIIGGIDLGSYNLTLELDVIVKGLSIMGFWAYGSGIITTNGTKGHEVYFTSKNDDTIGEIIDGSTGIPNYDGIEIETRDSDNHFNYTIFRHGGNFGYGATIFCYYAAIGTMYFNHCEFEDNWNVLIGNKDHLIIDNCIFKFCHGMSIYAFPDVTMKNTIFWEVYKPNVSNSSPIMGCNITAINCLFKSSSAQGYVYYAAGTLQQTFLNCTFIGYTFVFAVYLTNPVYTLSNCIFKDCIKIFEYPVDIIISDYNCYHTANTIYINLGEHDILLDPKFVSKGLGELAFYLDQDISPCVDSGSQTAVAAELNDKGTDIDNVILDTGTVDMGYHYTYETVEPPVPSGVVNIAY